jgi:hypothetical protein
MLRTGGVLRLRDLIYDFQPSEADAVVEIVTADFRGSVYGAHTCRRR